MRSMTVASLPRIVRFRRVPKISAILSAVRRHKPSSQLRSNSLWMGKLRLKMKLRQYSIWAIAYVTVGQLVLFSTETGDAWLLDPADRLAARLARDGENEPIHIEAHRA